MNYQYVGYAFADPLDDDISSPAVRARQDPTYGFEDPGISDNAAKIAETEKELAALNDVVDDDDSTRKSLMAGITGLLGQFTGKKSGGSGKAQNGGGIGGPLVLGGAVLATVAVIALSSR